MTVLKLYHNDMSVCAAKVRIVLAEKGLKWEGEHLNLRAGDAQKPEYLKLNPGAVVPTLIHDGTVVIESTVICEYLDHVFPAPLLRPANAFGAARMRLWTKQLDEGVHAATGTVSTCIAFRHQHLRKTPADYQDWLAKIPDPERRERSRLAVEKGVDSPGFAPAVKRFERLLNDIERSLAGGPWLAGDAYSLADVAYTPYMIRLRHLGFEDLIAARPHVADWAARLFARPSYEPAVGRWLNPAYLEIFERERPAARAKIRSIIEG